VLNDLDETIKAMLVKGVPLDPAEVDIAFEAPTSEWSASLARPTVNCYLYHLIENQDLRHNQWEMDRVMAGRKPGTGGPNNGNGAAGGFIKRRFPFRVDACYMITAWANEPEDEHRLLWRVLGALMRHSHLPPEMLQGTLSGQEWPMPSKTAQPEAPLKNPSDFWSSMEGPIRAGFNYIVTLPLDPEMIENIPLVLRPPKIITNGMPPPIPKADRRISQLGGWVRARTGAEAPPVVGATVQLVEPGLRVETDSQGRYQFAQAPWGRYTLRVSLGDQQTERVIELPGEDCDLVLAARNGDTAGDSTSPAAHTGSGQSPDSPGSKSRRR
jgi:hypothetical protein